VVEAKYANCIGRIFRSVCFEEFGSCRIQFIPTFGSLKDNQAKVYWYCYHTRCTRKYLNLYVHIFYHHRALLEDIIRIVR
jgi:hypothetical protein